MTEITTHVLDTTAGLPAVGVPVTLQADVGDGSWRSIGAVTTDDDGRTGALDVEAGAHRLVFDLAGRAGFYPEVTITFTARGEPQLHVPLLLSPYGYTTYRGS